MMGRRGGGRERRSIGRVEEGEREERGGVHYQLCAVVVCKVLSE